jgi:hypothetical protein
MAGAAPAPTRATVLALRARLRLDTLDLFGADLGAAGLAQLLAFLEMTANPAACAAIVDAQTGAVVGSAAPSLRAAVEWTCNASLMEKSGLASAMAVSQQQQQQQQQQSAGNGDMGALQRLSFSLPTVDIKGQQQQQHDSEATLLVIDQLVAFLRESPAARALRLLHFGWLSVHSNVPPPSLSSPPLSAALASPSVSSSFSAGSVAGSAAIAPFRLGASASSASLGMAASSSAASLQDQLSAVLSRGPSSSAALRLSETGMGLSNSTPRAGGAAGGGMTASGLRRAHSRTASHGGNGHNSSEQPPPSSASGSASASASSLLLHPSYQGIAQVQPVASPLLADHWLARFQALADRNAATTALSNLITEAAAASAMHAQRHTLSGTNLMRRQ